MSVMIKGMEMPENCYDCLFYGESASVCLIPPNGIIEKEWSRPDWCPLVEVPEEKPHRITVKELRATMGAAAMTHFEVSDGSVVICPAETLEGSTYPTGKAYKFSWVVIPDAGGGA